jgi:hypothetical protein
VANHKPVASKWHRHDHRLCSRVSPPLASLHVSCVQQAFVAQPPLQDGLNSKCRSMSSFHILVAPGQLLCTWHFGTLADLRLCCLIACLQG